MGKNRQVVGFQGAVATFGRHLLTIHPHFYFFFQFSELSFYVIHLNSRKKNNIVYDDTRRDFIAGKNHYTVVAMLVVTESGPPGANFVWYRPTVWYVVRRST